MKEPKIRFKGFQGEWVEKALKEVAPLQRGFDLPSHSICTGLIPIAYSNGVLNYNNIGKCYAPGLVTGRSGTIGKFTFIESGMYWPHNTSLWVTNFFNNVPKYIYYMYHTIGIEKYSTGSGVPTLNRNDVHDIIIYCPSIAEQQSIADYFTNLDSLIQSTTKKIESLKQVKAASLQSMFPQEGETTPRVRFKGFEGEWNTPSISEVFEIRNGYTPSKAVDAFWEGGTIPWFRMEDIREKGGILHDAIQHITPLGIKGNGLFEKNSIILSTTATIGVHAMLIADSLANQQFTNFSIRKSLKHTFDPMFVYYSFFGIDEWSKKNTNSGGLLSVNIPLLLKQPFLTPSINEQQKIASHFTNLDRQITLQSQRLEKLKQIKAACLDKMFV